MRSCTIRFELISGRRSFGTHPRYGARHRPSFAHDRVRIIRGGKGRFHYAVEDVATQLAPLARFPGAGLDADALDAIDDHGTKHA